MTLTARLTRAAAAVPAWIWVAALALPFRVPLLAYPEPGRDEAAYWYWSRHFELGYAPLLQLGAWASSLLPIPDLLALRLPSLVAGIAVLALFDCWLARIGATTSARWAGLLVLALSPWQTFAGATLHPDGLFLAALLLFALATANGRVLLATAAVVLAVWAKPTGFLLVPVALWLWTRDGSLRAPRGATAVGLVALGLAPVAASWNLAMVREVAEFGRAGGPPVALAGGLLLAAASVAGAWAVRWHSVPPERLGAVAAALVLLLVFGAAAVLRDQFKLNWVLPAAVLLWPSRLAVPRWLVATAIVCLAISSGALALAAALPREALLQGLRATPWGALAGPLLEWWQAERLGVADLAATDAAPPDWVVADDYGAAAQFAYRWRAHDVRIHVPSNALFADPGFSGETSASTLWLVSDSRAVIDGEPALPPPGLHAAFDSLLVRYATPDGVRYADWKASTRDSAALSDYVALLEAQRPNWPNYHTLAYWTNFYNAATLELVLAHYPVKSIKDIGGPQGSPWRRLIVQGRDRKLSLDDIEHNVIRRYYPDARIHFALNCASVGCPPLATTAFRGDSLDAQLDAVTRRVLNDTRWVEVTPTELRLTKLFDWYRKDFERDGASERGFVWKYRPADREAVLSEARKIVYKDYEWRLNEAK